jgi:glutamate formiminotransferase/formiminotetrahydrofolate cyclodeaminase
MKLVECVPNFSEGKNIEIIKEITTAIESVSGIHLLDVDPGGDTNRTVVTFVGEPNNVVKAAFLGIQKAAELINMQEHTGAHARMGATDVCPFVPVSNITMKECVQLSHELAKQVGDELGISVYMYENSATNPNRVNLANIRAGEYEGMETKLQNIEWNPDYGPTRLNKSAGVTAIGAREFLVAYNINLNTKHKKIATDIALDIREAGRAKRDANKKIIRDKEGAIVKVPGSLKSTKAVGWFIDEYNVAQVSMNLTNFNITAPHEAFEEVRQQARKRGVRVTGSELVGLIPLQAMLNAGKFYLLKQNRSTGIPESEIIHIAIKSMGLDEIAEFDPAEKIVEYRVAKKYGELAHLKLTEFNDELSSESPAPGGGSVSALAGALGASLSAMVGNLTIGKKGFETEFSAMNELAVKGQKLKESLLQLIDKDTDSFNNILQAMRHPKKTESQKIERNGLIQEATKEATLVPFEVVQKCVEVIDIAIIAASKGNPNSISDAGVAGEIASAGTRGAGLNVKINTSDITDDAFVKKILNETDDYIQKAEQKLLTLRNIVETKLNNG